MGTTTGAVDLIKLTKPFDRAAVKNRELPGSGGKRVDYVEGHTVIHRLNAATGNTWTFVIAELTSHPAGTTSKGTPQTLWLCRGSLTLPGLGTRAGIGVQTVTEKAEDLIKGCVTDCLKSCAKAFGVALELYGPDYEHETESVEPNPGRREKARTVWAMALDRGWNLDELNRFALAELGAAPEVMTTSQLEILRNRIAAVELAAA